VTATLAIGFADVLSAADQLRGVARVTPTFSSQILDDLAGHPVIIKAESFQRTGAFKFRGAYNALSRLTPEQQAAGVVASSSGNHAQGVALAAKLLGIRAVICMNSDAPAIKVQATRGYGAEIIEVDRTVMSAEERLYEVAAERGLTVIHPYDNPHIMAGQGTAALELLREHPDIDVLVMPVGGGGLISGCCVAARGIDPTIRIFGVETEGADDTHQSLRSGRRVTIPPPQTIADGIRLTTPGELTFPVVQELADDVLVVRDQDALDALRFSLLRMKLVIEPSGALPIAAAMLQLLPRDTKKAGVIISGGNIDPSLFGRLWST
jgi:threonine dehydratase